MIKTLHRVWRFYYEGFRDMTVGRTLWLIIIIKLAIMFLVLRLIFFPNILKRDFDNDSDRAEHVRHELTERNHLMPDTKVPIQRDGAVQVTER